MKTITLTQGFQTKVDDEDFEHLSKFKWCFDHGYAIRRHYLGNGKGKKVYLHRFLLSALGRDQIVDHKNHDTLDNRRKNLRLCSPSQSTANTRRNKHLFSRGITLTPEGRFRARINFKRKKYHLGHFDSLDQAKKAYESKAKELFGAFYCSL